MEGCARLFCTPAERRRHLSDHHMYLPAFRFDTLHLGSGRAGWRRAPDQERPVPGPRRARMDPDQHRDVLESMQRHQVAGRGTASPACLPAADREADEASGQCLEGAEGGQAVSSSMDVDSITEGVSRLSTVAGRDGRAGVPDQVSFGRRGRGAFGQRSRGGRGGVLEGA